MNFICVCVRVPKCGSTSLSNSLKSAFAERQIFHLPHMLNIEGNLSRLQKLRFHRSQVRNVFGRYRTTSVKEACRLIGQRAVAGDLISGGHIDFPSVQRNIARDLKMILMLRDPAGRCRSEYNYCRRAYFQKSVMSRFDAAIIHKTAGTRDFDDYLDFMLDHAPAYANLASRYVGWDGTENLSQLFAQNVFHSGVLERSSVFARGLAEKMKTTVQFPHDNRTENKGAARLTAAQRRKIEKLYPLDFALYEWLLAHLGEGTPLRTRVSIDA